MTEEQKPEAQEPEEQEPSLEEKVEILAAHLTNIINVIVLFGQRLEAVEDFLEDLTVKGEEGPEHGGH